MYAIRSYYVYSDNSGTAWTRDWQLGTQPTMLVRCLRGSTYALTFNGAFYRYDDAQSSWQQRGTIEQFNPTNLPLNYRAAYELVQDQAGRLYLHQREGSTFDRRMQIVITSYSIHYTKLYDCWRLSSFCNRSVIF